MRNPWAKTYSIRCPDGTTRTVYNKIDDIFPLHLKYAKRSASASISGLHSLKAKAEFKNDSKISAVLTGVDSVNQSIQTHFRAAYSIYEASPCTELPYFKSAVEKIIIDEQRLRAVESIISRMIDTIIAQAKSKPLEPSTIEFVNSHLTLAMNYLLSPSAHAMMGKMVQIEANTREWRDNG